MALLETLSPDALAERDRQREAAPLPLRPIADRLAGHVIGLYEEARRHKDSIISPRLLDCERRRNGEYDPRVLTEIERAGGSKRWHGLTETKVLGLISWLSDLLQTDQRPFAIEPTPIPDLPDDISEQIVARTMAEWAPRIAVGEAVAPEAVFAYARAMHDELLKARTAEAKRRADRMEDLIADRLTEGGFWDALEEFLDAFATYPTAFLKGPVVEFQTRVKHRQDDESGTWLTELIDDDPVQCWYAVSPKDIYPSPHARNIQEGYVIERVRYDGETLDAMRRMDGFDAAAIEDVIRQGASSHRDTYETEREVAESRDTTIDTTNNPFSTYYEALEFWGSIGADLAAQFGIETQGRLFVPVQVIVIGSRTIRAMANPDPLGQRPYYAASFWPVPKSLWGRGLPEIMSDCQDGYNQSMRALDNNVALSSGPQVAVDIAAFPPEFDWRIVRPWRVWPVSSSSAPNMRGLPVSFFQPAMHAQELLGVAAKYDDAADNKTLIPRYAIGGPSKGGAADTASGLSMLLNAASKGLRRALVQIDGRILRPTISWLYRWLMVHHDDDSAKGDCQVVARGVLHSLIRESSLAKTQAFARETANPIDLQIMQLRGRAKLLRSIATQLQLPVDVIPTDEEIEIEVKQAAMLAQQAQAAPPAAGPSGGAGAEGQDGERALPIDEESFVA